MRRTTFLNVILTVNAVLLAALVWTQLADTPVLADTAVAQPPRIRVPNAAEQRQRMIDGIADLKKSVDQLQGTLKSGGLKVEVSNLNEISLDNWDR